MMSPTLMAQCAAWQNRLRNVTDRLDPWVRVSQALPLSVSGRLQVESMLGRLESGIETLAEMVSACSRYGRNAVSPALIEQQLERLSDVAEELDGLLSAEAGGAGLSAPAQA